MCATMVEQVLTEEVAEVSPSPLSLSVNKMDGSSVQVQVSSDSTVMLLKGHVKAQCGVSELCQKLVAAGVEMMDSQKIGDFCSDGDAVLLVVSNEKVYEYLQHPEPKMRLMAVEAIKDVRQLDYVRAVRSLAQLSSREGEPTMRSAVVISLASIASRDDESAASALANFAKREITKCQVAVNAIAAMLIEGNPTASRVMKQLLEMSPCRDTIHARQELACIRKVLEAIGKEAQASEKGTAAFVKALSWAVQGVGGGSLSSTSGSGVRAVALNFCAKMTKRGDKDMINVYRAHCKDPEADVRIAVAKGLGKTLPDYSSGIVQGILPLVDDRDPEVREASVRALSLVKCQMVDLPKLASTVVRHLGDVDPGVRFAAVETLSEFARRGDDIAAAAVAKLPEDFD